MDGRYFTSFDGAKIYYHATVRDKNKWLIFLHGLGGDLTAWQKERRHFDSLGISTIALDQRGHGLSEKRADKSFYLLDNFAKDVVAIIKAEKLKNPIVVGHCFGGMVSIYLGAKFPRISNALVLVDTSYKLPFFSDHPVASELVIHILDLLAKVPDIDFSGHTNYRDFVNTWDLDLRRILTDILHTSLRSYLLITDDLIGYDARDLLRQIIVPSLVVDGTKDTVFPPKIAAYLNRRIKRSELDLIPGANHILVLNNPKDLSNTIESFLRKIAYF